jgi:hypothetical protein
VRPEFQDNNMDRGVYIGRSHSMPFMFSAFVLVVACERAKREDLTLRHRRFGMLSITRADAARATCLVWHCGTDAKMLVLHKVMSSGLDAG